jgi:NAD(P)-dependent dehydrogenase (short-subunit alcohol dehydrogenase family)
MSKRLADQVAVVTGTGGGIGKAIALRFAREGAAVVCAGLNPETNAETVREIEQAGGRASFVRTDIRFADDNARMIQHGIDQFGAIDIVANHAGITPRGRKIHETSEEEWDEVFDTNVKGIYHSARAVIPHFLERGHGNIILTSSAFGILATPGYSAYCPSKAAIIMMAKQMALDYGPSIRVNAVCPGATEAPQLRRFIDSTPDPAKTEAEVGQVIAALKRIGQPDEIADAVLFLASDESRFMTGHALVVDGGQSIDA